MRTPGISVAQLGHGSGAALGSAVPDSVGVPQCGQNCVPANIAPKHLGHVTVASAERQYAHCAAFWAAGAPQFGQLS